MQKLIAENQSINLARARAKNAKYSAIMGLMAKVVSITVSFTSIPMTMNYLGKDQFGIWVTITSMIALFSFADFGIGNGLINAVARAHGRDARYEIRVALSNSLLFLTTIAVVGILILPLITSTLDLQKILKTAEKADLQEIRKTLNTFFILFALSLPLNLVVKIQIGMQKGYINGLYGIAGGILTLVLLKLAINNGAGLSTLLMCLMGGPLLLLTLNSAAFFILQNQDLIPRKSDYSFSRISGLLNVGMAFLALQLIAGITPAIDNFIIAHALGVKEVGDFSIAAKLFGIVAIVNGLILQPLWPAYRESISRGDIIWASEKLQKSVLLSIGIATFISANIIFLLPKISVLWLGHQIHVPLKLALGFAAFVIIDSISMCVATFLNGAGILTRQIVTGALYMLLNLAFKYYLVKTYGLEVLPWIAACLCLTLVVFPLYLSIKWKWVEIKN